MSVLSAYTPQHHKQLATDTICVCLCVCLLCYNTEVSVDNCRATSEALGVSLPPICLSHAATCLYSPQVPDLRYTLLTSSVQCLGFCSLYTMRKTTHAAPSTGHLSLIAPRMQAQTQMGHDAVSCGIDIILLILIFYFLMNSLRFHWDSVKNIFILHIRKGHCRVLILSIQGRTRRQCTLKSSCFVCFTSSASQPQL